MKQEDLLKLMDKLGDCVANKPSPEKISVLMESILDNRLTDEEIRRGYVEVRDSPSPFWPSPGEFKAKARPVASSTISGEAETIFQHLIDHPTKYGKYNPNAGVIIERKLVEKHHGVAAGIAFAAVASRFRGLLEESVPFVRKDFQTAYEDARRVHGAPVTLSLPGTKKSLPAPTEEAYEPF